MSILRDLLEDEGYINFDDSDEEAFRTIKQRIEELEGVDEENFRMLDECVQRDNLIEELRAKNQKAIELAEDFMNANDVGDYVIPVHLATYLCDAIIKALKGDGDG